MLQVRGPGSLRGPDAFAESVASSGRNNLYRTSCFFEDEERYRAFCALYAVMRRVDDRVDGFLAGPDLSPDARRRELSVLNAWRRTVMAGLAARDARSDDLLAVRQPHASELLDAFGRAAAAFPLSRTLWVRFFEAMKRDLVEDRFATYADFLRYAEGAAIVPTTIYLHLITAEPEAPSGAATSAAELRHGIPRTRPIPYRPRPGFALAECGRELGTFAYLAHILRDLAEDVRVGEHGLLYISAEDMAKHGVSEARIRSDVAAGAAGPKLCGLVEELASRAWIAAARGRSHFDGIRGTLPPDRALILELIVRVYEEVLTKIARHGYDVTTTRHRLTDAEKSGIALRVARELDAAHRSDGVGHPPGVSAVPP